MNQLKVILMLLIYMWSFGLVFGIPAIIWFTM